jgi:hypothetical protein
LPAAAAACEHGLIRGVNASSRSCSYIHRRRARQRYVSIGDGEAHEISRIDTPLKDVNFSVTPDRKARVLSQIGTAHTDVGMFTLTRAEVR